MARAAEGRHFLGAIFAHAECGPGDGEHHRGGTDIEAEPDGIRHLALRRGVGDPEVREQRRQQAANHRARADEPGLQREALCALVIGRHVADKRAERLHRYVERGVEQPEESGREQQHAGLRQAQQR